MKMIGNTTKGCKCCQDQAKVPARRALKRRERAAWKKEISR